MAGPRTFWVILLASFCIHPGWSQPEYDESFKDNPQIILADSLVSIDQFREAIRVFDAAQIIFKESGDHTGYVYTLNQIGYCYRRMREWEKAYAYLSRAVAEGKELLGPDHPELGRTYYHFGYYYYFTEKLDSSLWARELSVKIREQALPALHLDLAQSYRGLGSHYQRIGNSFKALQYYEKYVKILEAKLEPEHLDLAWAYALYGYEYLALRDYFRAKIYLLKTVNIFENNPTASPSLKRLALNRLANAYVFETDFVNAKKYYHKAVDFISETYGQNSTELINPLNNLGEAYLNLQIYDSADISIRQSIEINNGSNQELLSNSYQHLANLKSYFNDLEEAKVYALKSLRLRLDLRGKFYGDNDRDIADLFQDLAHIHAKDRNYDSALYYIQKSLIELEPDFISEDIHENPDIFKSKQPWYLYHYLSEKAEVLYLKYLESGNPTWLNQSIMVFLKIDQLTNKIRNGTLSEHTKLQLSSEFKRNANKALVALVENFRINQDTSTFEKVFEILEKSKYAQILNNLAKVQSISSAGLPDSIRKMEQNLLLEIETQRQLQEFSDEESMAGIQEDLFNLERQYLNFQIYLAAKYPAYYNVKYDSIILTIAEVRQNLDQDTQVIEFHWGEESVTVLSFTKDQVILKSITDMGNLNTQLQSFLDITSTPPDITAPVEEVYSEYVRISRLLYQDLLGDVIQSDVNQLIIIPDGRLSLLPFEALITDDQSKAFTSANYLISNYDVQYAYNCNLLFKNLAPDPENEPSLLAFGYSDGESGASDQSRSKLAEIPQTAREIRAISEIFKRGNNQYLLGDEASETAFKELAGNYEILHIAVHGVGDPVLSINSNLRFRQAGDTLNDGKLYAHELYNLNLDRLRLAVLSACETGMGKSFEGEGVFSIARGFAYAGSPATVMSLWQVSDQFTGQLMKLFYKKLSNGLTISNALRQAKLDFISNNDSRIAHPYYWAAFVPLGDNQPVTKKGSLLGYLWWIIPVAIIAYLIIRRK